jgi:VWFA-related protein
MRSALNEVENVGRLRDAMLKYCCVKNRTNFDLLLCAGVLALALLVTSIGFAQSTAPQKAVPESPAQTLRVASRLVQVSVIVRYRGAPVTGLTKDDFTILDQNRQQQIANFSEQTYEPAALTSSTGAAAKPAAIFSNRFDSSSAIPPSVTIILLDALNTPRQQMANARAEIAKFLKQLQPNDRVALYGLSTNLYVLHNFTSDAASLLAALDHSKNINNYHSSASEIEPSDTGSDNIDAFMDASNKHAADMQTINRVEMTANVMAAIANSVVNVPGRKNLVWVSASFPFQIGTGTVADDPSPSGVASSGGMSPNNSNAPGPNNSVQYRTFQKELEAASEAVNNANLAIYPVDARGLIGASNMSADVRTPMPTSSSAATRSRRPVATSQPTPPRENYDTMIDLADRTGGRAYFNTNDIEHSVRQAVDDSRDSYVMDYYPADTQWDGTFHTIKIEVKRPGAEVRFRKGYFAIPDAASDPLRTEQMMQDAMSSPFQDADLSLTVEAHPGAASGTRQISARIGIDANRLHLKQSGENWTDDIQIIWLQFGPDGKPVSARTQSLSLNLSTEEYSRSQHGDVQITRDVTLRNEAVKLRIVVRDIASGAIGSVDIPLAKVFAPPVATPPAN